MINKILEKKIKIRVKNHNDRAIRLGLQPIEGREIRELILNNYMSGFHCGYCKQQLYLNPIYPYGNAMSIDHKLPLKHKGTHTISNLIVCCHSCNIIKGTMNDHFYKRLLNLIRHDNELVYALFESAHVGRLANKIKRKEQEENKQ